MILIFIGNDPQAYKLSCSGSFGLVFLILFRLPLACCMLTSRDYPKLLWSLNTALYCCTVLIQLASQFLVENIRIIIINVTVAMIIELSRQKAPRICRNLGHIFALSGFFKETHSLSWDYLRFSLSARDIMAKDFEGRVDSYATYLKV